jgi:hypothetical protein
VRLDEVQLQLPYELIPENAPRFAEDIAAQGGAVGVGLDYSADSIAYFDSVIESLRANNVAIEQVAEVLLGLGCFLGEAIVRATGGHWRSPAGTSLAKSAPFPIVVLLPDGRLCDPAARPFGTFERGESASLSAFFAAWSTPAR